MSLTPWKIAAVLILLAALTYRLTRTDDSAAPPSTPATPQTTEAPEDLVGALQAANGRMSQVSQRFGDAVAATFQGDVDAEALARTHEETLDVIQTIQGEFGRLKAPKDDASRQLLEDYKTYLAWQEKVYLEDFAQLVRRLVTENMSPLERRNVVMGVFHERFAEEDAWTKRLDTLVKRVAPAPAESK